MSGLPLAPDTAPRPRGAVVSVRKMRKGTLRAFIGYRFPTGLTVYDIVVHEKETGARWASLPAKPMLDKTGTPLRDEAGKIRYSPVLEWEDKATARLFSNAVCDLVASQWPDVFDAAPEAAP